MKSTEEQEKGEFYNLAFEIEKEILKGELKIRKTETNNEIYFYNNDFNLNLPINLVSSSISELIPFVIYLKYILCKNDTLIIEEPEAHLHPANQRILAKYFTEAINQGLKIIITTHSDYMIEQLNNHIRLSNVDKNKLNTDSIKYNEIDILYYKNINIYNFTPINLFEFNTEEIYINSTGFIEDNFSKVSSDLYDEINVIISSKEE